MIDETNLEPQYSWSNMIELFSPGKVFTIENHRYEELNISAVTSRRDSFTDEDGANFIGWEKKFNITDISSEWSAMKKHESIILDRLMDEAVMKCGLPRVNTRSKTYGISGERKFSRKIITEDAGPSFNYWIYAITRYLENGVSKLSDAFKLKLLKGYLESLQDFHEKGFVHMDIATRNICMPFDVGKTSASLGSLTVVPIWNKIKVIDFGCTLHAQVPLEALLRLAVDQPYQQHKHDEQPVSKYNQLLTNIIHKVSSELFLQQDAHFDSLSKAEKLKLVHDRIYSAEYWTKDKITALQGFRTVDWREDFLALLYEFHKDPTLSLSPDCINSDNEDVKSAVADLISSLEYIACNLTERWDKGLPHQALIKRIDGILAQLPAAEVSATEHFVFVNSDQPKSAPQQGGAKKTKTPIPPLNIPANDTDESVAESLPNPQEEQPKPEVEPSHIAPNPPSEADNQRLAKRFEKLAADGRPLPNDARDFAALRDKTTQLIWEVKTLDGFHSIKRRCTNQDDGLKGDSSDFIRQVNQQKFAGYSDWRLPTRSELYGLFKTDLNPDWGGLVPDSNPRLFWSSTPRLLIEEGSGLSKVSELDSQHHIWLVRGPGPQVQSVPNEEVKKSPEIEESGKPSTAKPSDALQKQWEQRFVKLDADGKQLPGNATSFVALQDRKTSLIWEIKANSGLRSREHRYTNVSNGQSDDTSHYVQQVNLGRLAGHNQWRLPTVNELQELMSTGVLTAWETTTGNYEYWTSDKTTAMGGYYAAGPSGASSTQYLSYSLHVRLVCEPQAKPVAPAAHLKRALDKIFLFLLYIFESFGLWSIFILWDRASKEYLLVFSILAAALGVAVNFVVAYSFLVFALLRSTETWSILKQASKATLKYGSLSLLVATPILFWQLSNYQQQTRHILQSGWMSNYLAGKDDEDNEAADAWQRNTMRLARWGWPAAKGYRALLGWCGENTPTCSSDDLGQALVWAQRLQAIPYLNVANQTGDWYLLINQDFNGLVKPIAQKRAKDLLPHLASTQDEYTLLTKAELLLCHLKPRGDSTGEKLLQQLSHSRDPSIKGIVNALANDNDCAVQTSNPAKDPTTTNRSFK